MTKQTKNNIEKAIRQLCLKDSELKVVSLSDINKICDKAKCSLMEVMWYLRYER